MPLLEFRWLLEEMPLGNNITLLIQSLAIEEVI